MVKEGIVLDHKISKNGIEVDKAKVDSFAAVLAVLKPKRLKANRAQRYTPLFLTHSDEALEIEKFKRSRENKIEFANDYGNLNASYVNEKINFEDDYFLEIINPDFEKIDSPFQQTSSLKPYVSNVILKKIIIDMEDEVVNILEKEKLNLETIKSLKLKGVESSETVSSESKNQSENDCHVVEK
nr:hypothetical protein [Tanacetum cinerariifolium]